MKLSSYRLISFLVLSSCIIEHSSYARSFQKLPKIDTEHAYSETKNDLSVTMQLFTHQDCKKYFGYDLLSHNCRPLILHIANNSDISYSFNPSGTNLTLVSPTFVANKLSFPLFSILLATGIPGINYFQHKAGPPLVLIAAALWWYNTTLRQELLQESLDIKSGFKVLPYQSVTKLIFCNESGFLSQFIINLTNEVTKETASFQVDLLQKKRSSNPFISHLTVC